VDDGPFDLTQCAKDLVAAIETLQLTDVHLFGTCLGSSIAIQMYLHNPSLISSLTLCGNDAFVETKENLEQYQFMRDACLAPADDGKDQLASDVVKGLHWMLFGDNISAVSLIEEWVVTTRLRPSNGPLINKLFSTLLEPRRFDLGLLANVKCPVLVLHGDQDSTSPPEVAHAIDDALLNAWRQLCIIPGGPHYLSWTHPHQVNNITADFLDRLTGTDSTDDVLRPRKGSASSTLPFPYPDVTIKRKTSVAAGIC
jgi:pimeloyl-ACP methyl ester carboxylesterase